MKYKLHAFFSNRNGIDELGRTLLWVALAIMILGTLFGITFLYNAALILLLYAYFHTPFFHNIQNITHDIFFTLRVQNLIFRYNITVQNVAFLCQC